jgi:hypothetical protein
VSREVHARFCERRRVRLPPPTLLVLVVSGTRAQTEALREEVAAVLAQVGLRLSEQKTRIAHIDEGFDFLVGASSANPSEARSSAWSTPTRPRRP